jgi:malate dehydrogenase (oxaloacetate-decarboxylating)(NADP+)
VPFDPRLISARPAAVAKAAMDTGVARKPIVDMDAYRAQLRRAAIRSPASLQRSSSGARRPSASSSPRARRSR